MADVLPGFTYDRTSARFRNTSTGRYVSRERGPQSIMRLLNQSVSNAEQRMGDIVQGVISKELAPGYAQTMMRDELRRLSLQNAALGKGGIDKLTFADYGRAGQQLRTTYGKVTNLLRDVESGKVSLAQAMQRIRGYAGESRVNFFKAQNDALRNTGKLFEQRRRLNPAEHCRDCVRWAGMSWQPIGVLPAPGEESKCGYFCRCTMETREITPEMMQQRLTAQLEGMMA